MNNRGTYHRNGNDPEQHYRVLIYLQNGGDPDITAIANELHIHKATVRVHINRLVKEGMLTAGQILKDFVITLTDDGATRKAPVKDERPVKLHPCGHPVAASTPDWCMVCYQIRRKQARGIRVRMTAQQQVQQ